MNLSIVKANDEPYGTILGFSIHENLIINRLAR